MKHKKKIILIISFISIILLAIFFYIAYKNAVAEITNNITLNTDNYLTSVEVNSKSDFILFINKKKKISNIIFLNSESVTSLYKKDIEKKDIEEGIKLIVDNLKTSNEFDSDLEFQLISYGNNDIYSLIKEEFNKEFVIYGVNNVITEGSTTLEEKAAGRYKNQSEILKMLYDDSMNIVSQNREKDNKSSNFKEDNMATYALNVYKKLENYSVKITEQSKDSAEGMDITTLNSTGDYTNELYANANSWYYVTNGVVYAYIEFNSNNKIYSYCFSGTESYKEGNC